MTHSFADLPETITVPGTNIELFKIIPDTFQPPEYMATFQAEGETPVDAKQKCLSQAKSVEVYLKNFFKKYELDIVFSHSSIASQQKIGNENSATGNYESPNPANAAQKQKWLVIIDVYFKIRIEHENASSITIEDRNNQESEEGENSEENTIWNVPERKIYVHDISEKDALKAMHYSRGLRKILSRL